MTIGAVCKALAQEFPDISISKIRYLEDQKLLDAAAHAGRLPALHAARRRAPAHDPAPAARRVPAAARHPPGAGLRAAPTTTTAAAAPAPHAGRAASASGAPSVVGAATAARCTRSRTCSRRRARTRARRASSRSTASSRARPRAGTHYYDETEREIVRAVTELARYGVGGRNLRVFRTSADREAALLQQILAPALRSRNPERRKEAIEALENLAAVATHLKHLLLDPRPAQDRRTEAADVTGRRRRSLRATSATSRTSRKPGIVLQDITPLLADAGGARRRGRARWPSSRAPLRRRRRHRRRGARLPARPGARARARRRLRAGAQARQAAARRRSAPSTCSSTGPTRSSCTPTPSAAGARVLVHDDLLATGGTARALCELVEQLGGEVVGCAFLIELAFLAGRERAGAARRARAASRYDAE